MSEHDDSAIEYDEEEEDEELTTNNTNTNTTKNNYVYEEDLDDGYDSDYMGDSNDRKYLDSLSELKREDVLYQRYQHRSELQKRKELLKKEGRLIPRGQKPKSLNNSQTITSTTNNNNNSMTAQQKKNASLNDMKLKREKKKQSTPPTVTNTTNTTSNNNRGDNNDLIDEESDEEDNEYFSKECQITKLDLERIVIKRSALEREYKEPYFSKSIVDAFVRVLIGVDESRNKKVYRLCKIQKVIEMKSSYEFNKEMINKGLQLVFGVQTKSWPMSNISDKNIIDENEFKFWKTEMERVGEKYPTLKYIEDKVKQWKQLKDYIYTDKEIDEMIKEKKKKGIFKNKSQLVREISDIKLKLKSNEFENENEKTLLENELYQLQLNYEELEKKEQNEVVQRINDRNKNLDQSELKKRRKVMKNNKDSNELLDPFARRKTTSSFFSLGGNNTNNKDDNTNNKTSNTTNNNGGGNNGVIMESCI
ncbi:hypothetical protein ABK040_002205 [Willaertia magna]